MLYMLAEEERSIFLLKQLENTHEISKIEKRIPKDCSIALIPSFNLEICTQILKKHIPFITIPSKEIQYIFGTAPLYVASYRVKEWNKSIRLLQNPSIYSKYEKALVKRHYFLKEQNGFT